MLPVSPLEDSLAAAHEIFAKGSRTTLKSGGSASGINGTKNISHIDGIGSYIHQAFRKKTICDISFQVGDCVGDLMMPVHKVVLASQSSLFKDIFEAKEFLPKPVTPKIIRLRNVDPAAMEVFINFLYTGNIEE